jgi:hypothetical protein
MLHYYSKLERVARKTQSILLDPLVSYKENKVLCIRPQMPSFAFTL